MSKTKKGGASSNALSVMRRQEHHHVTPILDGSACTGLCVPCELLFDLLCHELGATGAHAGCEHGVRGAYTVRVDGMASRSYLVLAVQTDGRAADTAGSLATYEGLSDLQEVFRRRHALQCGPYTAGTLMSCTDYLGHVPEPTEAQMHEMLFGHLCHCTGYTPIVAVVLDVATNRAGARPTSTPVSEEASNA